MITGAAAHALGLAVRVAGSDALEWLVLPVSGLLLFVGLVSLAIGRGEPACSHAGAASRWDSPCH